MINSIPMSALRLGIDFKGYEELANNIRRMLLIPKYQRLKILDRANKELSVNRNDVLSLINNIAEDRQVYEIAGLSYVNGPPEGEGLFTTALADYLLRHKTA